MSNTSVMEHAISLYNAGDLDGFVDTYTDNAVVKAPDGVYEGRQAIREYWNREKAAFPDRTITVGATVEQGETLASEFTWSGTNTGPLVLPDGTQVPPTGRHVEVRCMDLDVVRDGKLAEQHVYWDMMASAQQLGLVPGQEGS